MEAACVLFSTFCTPHDSDIRKHGQSVFANGAWHVSCSAQHVTAMSGNMALVHVSNGGSKAFVTALCSGEHFMLSGMKAV